MDLVGGETRVIIVDDGSTNDDALKTFERLEQTAEVDVVRHEFNQGKGAALKTGYRFVSEQCTRGDSVVTADADGQHLPEDIARVIESPVLEDQLILGVRDFSSRVPLRSKVGNKLTSLFIKLLYNTSLKDSQTGLRKFEVGHLATLASIDNSGYDYEFESLLYFLKRRSVLEIPIETVYEPGNPTSHFDPLLDSVKIYAVFFRHIPNIVLSGIIDYLVFITLTLFGVSVFWSLLLARFLSTMVYFFLAYHFVFRVNKNLLLSLIKFVTLVGFNIAIIWPFIDLAWNYLGLHPIIAMLFAYPLLAIINFLIQYLYVFNEKGSKDEEKIDRLG